MPDNDLLTVGKDGAIVIPDGVLRRLGLTEGSFVVLEERDEGLLLRPATTDPNVEIYTPERIAEFLLSNAIGEADYLDAVAEVRKLGLDPDSILHIRPDSI